MSKLTLLGDVMLDGGATLLPCGTRHWSALQQLLLVLVLVLMLLLVLAYAYLEVADVQPLP
jgi:hypothetical protein